MTSRPKAGRRRRKSKVKVCIVGAGHMAIAEVIVAQALLNGE